MDWIGWLDCQYKNMAKFAAGYGWCSKIFLHFWYYYAVLYLSTIIFSEEQCSSNILVENTFALVY